MPWSEKQVRLFQAAAHDPAIAKKHGMKVGDAALMASEGVRKGAGTMSEVAKAALVSALRKPKG